MSDLISRHDAIDALKKYEEIESNNFTDTSPISMMTVGTIANCIEAIVDLPSAEPERKWIPVTERLPEDKDWYLGIFKESDTGYCISIPFVCYYAGRKTMITTKDYWILRGYDDIYSSLEYYRNLECAAWMPLPEPWRGE